MPKYIKRDIELLLRKAFKQFPAVIITGARQSGKSTLVKHIFPKAKYLSLENLNIKPDVILCEHQRIPSKKNQLKI